MTAENHKVDRELLQNLRRHRRAARHRVRAALTQPPPPPPPATLGERLADWVAERIGSWRFILIQSGIFALWIAVNAFAWWRAWDPYPFILLNLLLSFQAAYAGPIIMMSQNRVADFDRRRAEDDYRINIKAEMEIELLHEKIDLLREQEIVKLIDTIEALHRRMEERSGAGDQPSPTAAA